MSDLTRKAVELADGWFYDETNPRDADVFVATYNGLADVGYIKDQWVLDALAAQLVRQVDALPDLWVCIEDDRTSIQHNDDGTVAQLMQMEKPDRTMNTIKAIVDSGVLESEDE